MSHRDPKPTVRSTTRRDFLKTTGVLAATGALAGNLGISRFAHAAGNDLLKVGLIGCGGRGTGAAAQALAADPNVRLTAVGDAFEDRLARSLSGLQKEEGIAGKIDVPPERQFVGFDAYKQVLASGIDVAVLATPPHFRPAHLAACVEAGVHTFCEKPVAVDAPGVRSVLASAAKAKEKNLSIVSGLCWRYHYGMRETFNRIADGALGDMVAMQVTYNTSGLWNHGRQPQWSDMEWQVRNWLYFTWLSGDHNVEQHIHSLDKAAWAMGETPPVRATGLGGRQVRTQSEYGHIFDHHAVVYEYESGVRLYSFCRQQDGCSVEVNDHFMGTKGKCDIMAHQITGETNWKYSGEDCNMYQVEHDELFASIRSGRPINNGKYMSYSTMLAIMGRMATYTGQTITWDQAMNSKEDLSPPAYEWGNLDVAPVPVPGITAFV